MSKQYTGGLTFTAPTKGETDWDVTEDAKHTKISGHDHTGSGNGTKIGTNALDDNSVSAGKVRLANDQPLRGLNAAGAADISIVKVDTNNLVALLTTTRFGMAAQAVTGAGAFTISNNLVTLSNAAPTAATINVPTASQAGQPVFVTNIGAGTWTVTITGQAGAYDVATILTLGSLILIPIGTTTWAAIAGGGTTLA